MNAFRILGFLFLGLGGRWCFSSAAACNTVCLAGCRLLRTFFRKMAPLDTGQQYVWADDQELGTESLHFIEGQGHCHRRSMVFVGGYSIFFAVESNALKIAGAVFVTLGLITVIMIKTCKEKAS